MKNIKSEEVTNDSIIGFVRSGKKGFICTSAFELQGAQVCSMAIIQEDKWGMVPEKIQSQLIERISNWDDVEAENIYSFDTRKELYKWLAE